MIMFLNLNKEIEQHKGACDMARSYYRWRIFYASDNGCTQ